MEVRRPSDGPAASPRLATRPARLCKAVTCEPAVDGVDALVGRVASTGFRAVIDSSTSANSGDLSYLLLDEIPVATLVSGYSVMHATSRGDLELQVIDTMRAPGPPPHGPNMCAGFQTGGTIMTSLQLGQHALVTGPDATPLLDSNDTLGWHDLPGPLAVDGMRRWRRSDLWRTADGDFAIETFFRDSHLAPDGVETIIHEYTVQAIIDADGDRVIECTATPAGAAVRGMPAGRRQRLAPGRHVCRRVAGPGEGRALRSKYLHPSQRPTTGDR
jgi:hypothetical protein